MKTLAIEISTDTGTVALLEGRETVFEREWVEKRGERQGFFTTLQELAATGTLDLADVDGFVVGVGPGSFAGLRMAVSAACGLAAPGGRRITGISSADATARAALAGSDAGEVIIWGDARRNELWAMRFELGTQWPERQGELLVGGFSVIPGHWATGDAIWATADWESIGPRLKAICPPGVALVEHRVIPRASHVGWLGVAKQEAGASTEPLLPVYVHPAVAAAPGMKGKPVEHEETRKTS